MFTCSLCLQKFDGYGNNPEPFGGVKCCDDCNSHFVVPVRLMYGRGGGNAPLAMLQRMASLGAALRVATKEVVK